ncbi:unnamed protein product, partial [Prorocentrum cordatum]
VGGAELERWRDSAVLLDSVEAELELLHARLSGARRRRGGAEEEWAAADWRRRSSLRDAEAAAASAAALGAAREAEAEARGREEAEFRGRAEELEAGAEAARRAAAAAAEEDGRLADALRREVAEEEAECSRARAEASAQAGTRAQARAASQAEEAMGALERAEARGAELEEARSCLKEELGTLRFSLKDMKSFQHRRTQELEGQVQRLERQRRNLEKEQAARQKSEESAEASGVETQLRRLQQLNARLTSQAREARVECGLWERQAAETRAEQSELLRGGREESEERDRISLDEQLDEISEKEGLLQRDKIRLRNKAMMLQKQVTVLDTTCFQMESQLEEVEAAL